MNSSENLDRLKSTGYSVEFRENLQLKWTVKKTPRDQEGEQKFFEDTVFQCTGNVCRRKRLGDKGIQTGSEW